MWINSTAAYQIQWRCSQIDWKKLVVMSSTFTGPMQTSFTCTFTYNYRPCQATSDAIISARKQKSLCWGGSPLRQSCIH